MALHPRGAKGYLFQLYGPFNISYADLAGSIREARNRLWCQSIPQLEWKVSVCCSQCCYESILESLDHMFSSVDAMVVGLHQLQLAIIFGKISLDVFCCLIIHDI